MKITSNRLILLFTLLCSILFVNTQHYNRESLKLLLTSSKEVNVRIDLLEKFSGQFAWSYSDTRRMYAEEMVEIRVKDSGNGISRNIVDKIFQPFFTAKPTGQGTGLGLSLSYDIIVKEHGGTLKVETREDEYAEFIIQLPCKE
jgi:signal transduction histidine kinase